MDDRQQGVKDIDEAPVGPSPRRTRTVLICVVAVLGALMVVENAGAATPRRRSAVSRATFGQGAQRPQVPPVVNQRPIRSGTSEASVLAQAQGSANSALARTRSFGSGTAEQHGFESSAACAIILSAAQRVTAQINGLIARFPQFAAQLAAIRDRVVAQLNAQLERFDCGVSVG